VGGRWEGARGQLANFFGVEKRLKKLINLGREDVFLVHPENGFNGLIFN
jgi:hypothetical protein